MRARVTLVPPPPTPRAQVAEGQTPVPFKVNMNGIAKALVPTKVNTSTPAANGNMIVQDILRGADCDMSMFLTSKTGPAFRRKVHTSA